MLREQRSSGERTAFTVALMRFNIVATERMMPNRQIDWGMDKWLARVALVFQTEKRENSRIL
jgi:hypothetical protein